MQLEKSTESSCPLVQYIPFTGHPGVAYSRTGETQPEALQVSGEGVTVELERTP